MAAGDASETTQSTGLSRLHQEGCVVADVSVCFFVFQLWVQERMAVATSAEHGHNLQTVQLLIKKNQVRSSESSIRLQTDSINSLVIRLSSINNWFVLSSPSDSAEGDPGPSASYR